MPYQVLARKWRPQVFEDVVGQEATTRTLQNAIKSERIAHAFLFCGVRGVGKTTTARILAKALNCVEGPTPSPCGKCDSCREIAESNSIDVLEIDAASNRGIDSIRELRASVQYGTARDRYKIFIIDEVHMLTNEAFNALLKTLEEPPGHVKFIMATTERQKIPVTITSRCQQFDFKPIPFQMILDRLKLISREEGFELSDYALRAVATVADGSMRDAQSTLDQMINFSGKQVRDEEVRALLGVVDENLVNAIMEAIIEKNQADLLFRSRDLADRGVDPQNFCRKLVAHIRNLLVCKVAGWDQQLLTLADAEKDTLLHQAEQLSQVDLIRLYDLLNRVEHELRWHPRPYIHLEMALLKLVELARLPALEEMISQLETGQLSSSSTGLAQRGVVATPRPVIPKPAAPARRAVASQASKGDVGEGRADDATRAGPGGDLVAQLFPAVQQESMRLHASLRSASDIQLDAERLMVRFSRENSLHAGVIQEADNRDRLLRLCAKITDASPQLEVKVDEAPAQEVKSPAEDPKLKAFIQKFPGKIIVEKNRE